ncbi:AraC family transcriptional regulator [Mahella australiensis]|uniref:Transcriptional regulator, AraC family n=1 Tax=Mahella australiensis (strain DSM 15567 / CIP 107919 / 50-1 BON) TaxID=697281 RepID=F3ZYT8_MAHA5|nr:AraC family transcriptional regulator [Mahella australiensis]AEE95683.1 transcriptional regulator, AraC family [Mahella australiensis 50-1 BON]
MKADIDYIIPNISYMVYRKCTPEWHLATRSLDFYNLMILTEGQCVFAWKDGFAKLTKGYGVLIPPGTMHSAVTDPDDLMHCYAFNFRYHCACIENDEVTIYDYKDVPLPLDMVFKVTNLDRIVNILRELNDMWVHQRQGYKIKANGLFNVVIGELMGQHRLKGIAPAHIKRIENAVDYINEHYDTPITIADLAECAGLSPTYFEAEFKRIMGCTPIEYINNLRIDRSIELLLAGNYTIGEIAEKVGFSDIFYFSRVFKNKKGVSPTNYIKSS